MRWDNGSGYKVIRLDGPSRQWQLWHFPTRGGIDRSHCIAIGELAMRLV